MNRTTIEHIRTGSQVDDVRTGLLVWYICMNRTTDKVRMYEQDHKYSMNNTSIRVCKNRTEYIIAGPQVEYVRIGLLVRYVCMNRTTSTL